MTRITNLLLISVILVVLAGCQSPPSLDLDSGTIGGPPIPPVPVERLRISDQSSDEPADEPVGTLKLADSVSTNEFGHIEFLFHTQTVWQGWEFEQSDDGYRWGAFARSLHTNNTKMTFFVVNGSPEIHSNRVYRLRRTH